MNTVLAIYRDPRFSPNSVEKDHAILFAVVERLRQQGMQVVDTVEAEVAERSLTEDFVLSMGRFPQTLQWLQQQQVPIVNRPEAVARCARSVVAALARRYALPLAPAEGSAGYWLKRGDACAQQSGDVVFCRNQVELAQQKEAFCKRGVTDYIVTAHVAGDLVKFYGVRGTGFFRYFYPTDDGETKFGDEQYNGQAHHYSFDTSQLQADVDRLAGAVGLDVYGGDCIVRADGTYCIIDFNDWPSFSRCRDEATEAIASLVKVKFRI